MGFIRPESGQYSYDAGDPRFPMQDVLNLATDAAHNRQLQNEARLASIEDDLAGVVRAEIPQVNLGDVGDGMTMNSLSRGYVTRDWFWLSLVLNGAPSNAQVVFTLADYLRPVVDTAATVLWSASTPTAGVARVYSTDGRIVAYSRPTNVSGIFISAYYPRLPGDPF